MRDPTSRISGSSVVTASLILACCLLALKDKEEFLRRQFIDKFFGKMQTANNLKAGIKYVEPSILFGKDKIEGQDLYKYVERAFAVRVAWANPHAHVTQQRRDSFEPFDLTLKLRISLLTESCRMVFHLPCAFPSAAVWSCGCRWIVSQSSSETIHNNNTYSGAA